MRYPQRPSAQSLVKPPPGLSPTKPPPAAGRKTAAINLRFHQEHNPDPTTEELDKEWHKGESTLGQCLTKLKNVSEPLLQYQTDAGKWLDVPLVTEIRTTPIYE